MKKFILMSVLIATIALPLAALKLKLDPKRGAKLMQKRLLIFLAIYVVMVLYIAPRLFR